MKDAFTKLWEFHEKFNSTRNKTPTLPTTSIREMRKRILQEEFEEYLEAEKNDDLVEIADALADIIYIAIGTGVAYGLPIDDIFNEVHRSNMSKLGADGKPMYREDGKILNGPHYSAPDIKRILESKK